MESGDFKSGLTEALNKLNAEYESKGYDESGNYIGYSNEVIAEYDAARQTIQDAIDFLTETGADTFGENFVDGWKEMLGQLQGEIVGLENQKIDTQKMIDEKPITHLGYQLDVLKQKAKETDRVLGDRKTARTEQEYYAAITRAIEQQTNLENQIAYYREKQSEYTFDDPEYQRYEGLINGAEEESYNLGEAIKNWRDNIKQLPVDRLNNDLTVLKNKAEDIQKVLNNDEEPESVYTYQEAIDNAMEQQENLSE